MTENNPHKKEPLPDQEQTASFDSNITDSSLEVNDKWHARLPEKYISKPYRDRIGSSIWLLLYLQVKCDWYSGKRRLKEKTIADALDVSVRTVRNWLRKLEDIGVSTKRYPYSIEIQLPPDLIPNKEVGKGKTSDRQVRDLRSANSEQENGKAAPGWQKAGKALRQRYDRFRA